MSRQKQTQQEGNLRSKKRGAIDKTIAKPRVGVLLSLLESRAISREDVLAKLFPHSEEAEEAALRSESALTPLEEFLAGLEHTWVGRTAELFDHLRKLYPNSRSPQLNSPRALGWAMRDWMEAGDPRISKKRTSAGQQYTIRPIEYKSEEPTLTRLISPSGARTRDEDCSSTGMLIHTLESSTFTGWPTT